MSKSRGAPPLPAETIQAIKDAHTAGFSNREVAEILGVSASAVRKYVTAPRKPGRPPTYGPDERLAIIRMFEAGSSSCQVAKHFGCSRDTVLRYASEAREQREQGS